MRRREFLENSLVSLAVGLGSRGRGVAGSICLTSTPGILAEEKVDLDKLVGHPVDVAPSAYQYRADRAADQNPPESWILLMQYANVAFTKPVDVSTPAIKNVLCGLLWEEIRPVRRVELSWSPKATNKPPPAEVVLSYFDGDDEQAHHWWNHARTVRVVANPTVSADSLTYVYEIPANTWGTVAALRSEKDASSVSVPDIRVYVDDVWKKAEIEIEWGFDEPATQLKYDGRLETYDAVVGDLRPLAGDSGTVMTGPKAWRSRKGAGCPAGRPGNRAVHGSLSPARRLDLARELPAERRQPKHSHGVDRFGELLVSCFGFGEGTHPCA